MSDKQKKGKPCKCGLVELFGWLKSPLRWFHTIEGCK